MTPNGLPPGTLLGAFEIVSTLGRGGMGAVYAAKNRITGDVRAVKVILPELVARPEFTGRFVREIRMAMAVDHPHLVRVFEPGMHGDVIFLPMELLQGESLAVFLRRQRSVTIEATNNLIQAIGSAIVALHAKGILHRDVKPSNIFLAHDRGTVVPKLLDLGAGKDVEGTEEATSTGIAIGSPHYMAPEQAAGRRDLDHRVDEYALGTVAYQLLTGARPYENDDTGHVLAKVLSGAPYKSPRQILGTIPPKLEAVVLKSMARAPEDRYQTVHEFLTALHAASMEAMMAFPVVPDRPPPMAEVTANTGPRAIAADPSGTVQTGVSQSRSRSSLFGAALGISGGIVTVVIGVAVLRALGSHSAPASVPTQFTAPSTIATSTASALAAPDLPGAPLPAAAAPSAAAPPPQDLATAPPAPPDTSLPRAPSTATRAPEEIDPTPVAHAPPPANSPVVAPPPAAPAATPPAAPTATVPRPRPRPAAPSGPEPCRPTPGSPCL